MSTHCRIVNQFRDLNTFIACLGCSPENRPSLTHSGSPLLVATLEAHVLGTHTGQCNSPLIIPSVSAPAQKRSLCYRRAKMHAIHTFQLLPTPSTKT